jgi:hypothetical protein
VAGGRCRPDLLCLPAFRGAGNELTIRRSPLLRNLLFDGDGDRTTTNDQLVTDGTIGGGFDFSLTIDVDWAGSTSFPDVVLNC